MSKLSNISTNKVEAVAAKSPLIARDADRIEYATDTRGRVIGVKQTTAIDMFEITLLFGQHSGNQTALNQALVAAAVVKVDDRTLNRPVSFLELKARISLLDFAGYLAAAEALGKFGEAVEDTADAIKN